MNSHRKLSQEALGEKLSLGGALKADLSENSLRPFSSSGWAFTRVGRDEPRLVRQLANEN